MNPELTAKIALVALECLLLAILAWRRPPLPWFAAWLAGVTIRSLIFTPADPRPAAIFGYFTLVLMVAAIAECVWGLVRDIPERSNAVAFAVCCGVVGLAATRGVQLHAGVLTGQIVRPYVFTALALALLGTTGLLWVYKHRVGWYAWLWLIHLGSLAVFILIPYAGMEGWTALFVAQRWEFCGVLCGWILAVRAKASSE